VKKKYIIKAKTYKKEHKTSKPIPKQVNRPDGRHKKPTPSCVHKIRVPNNNRTKTISVFCQRNPRKSHDQLDKPETGKGDKKL
jgi:hypothetical protein